MNEVQGKFLCFLCGSEMEVNEGHVYCPQCKMIIFPDYIPNPICKDCFCNRYIIKDYVNIRKAYTSNYEMEEHIFYFCSNSICPHWKVKLTYSPFIITVKNEYYFNIVLEVNFKDSNIFTVNKNDYYFTVRKTREVFNSKFLNSYRLGKSFINTVVHSCLGSNFPNLNCLYSHKEFLELEGVYSGGHKIND